MSNNLYLRRMRILLGGSLFGRIEYFFDTDSPNLFKAGADGVKGSSAMVVQDAFATFKALGDMVKIDAGYMLPPSATTPSKARPRSTVGTISPTHFSTPTRSAPWSDRSGVTSGVQVRGLVLDGHLEYRVGAFQGKRNAEITAPPATAGGPAGPVTDVVARNAFRVAGRLQINFLDPETGFFYNGTYLGAKHILSVGGAYDFQYSNSWANSYRYWTVDGFLDMPAGPGSVTAQVNLAQWHGGEVAAALTKRTAVMSEAGYRFADIQLSPIGRFEELWVPGVNGGADTTEARYGGGLAWWFYGHNSNLKAFYTRVRPSAAGEQQYNLFNVQWQIFFF